MKKILMRHKATLFYFKDGKKIEGKHEKLTGNCTGLSGDCTKLSGNLDDCGITEEDRKNDVNINDLVSV